MQNMQNTTIITLNVANYVLSYRTHEVAVVLGLRGEFRHG